MATGFVQRFKGKIATPVGGISIAGVQVTPTAADLNLNAGWGTVAAASSGSTISNTGIATIAASSAFIVNLANPVPGSNKLIDITTVSSAVFIKVATGTVTIQGCVAGGGTGGSTLTNTIKSTVASQIELMGLSTSQYLLTSVVPSTLTHLTFSTTT